MYFQHLGVINVRNLKATSIYPSANINILVGANGSGKTSVLESIFVLGRARSFRSSRLSSIATRGQQSFAISGQIIQDDTLSLTLRFAYQDGSTAIYADDRLLRKTSQLASYLPLIYVDSNSYRLLSDGPSQRRHYVDWGLFHVEPSFLPLWKRYSRALKQRNAAIRDGRFASPELWNGELAETGELIHALRNRYAEELSPLLGHYTEVLLGGDRIQTQYYAGWDTDQPFALNLDVRKNPDRALGYTRDGPHRADLKFRCDDRMLVDVLSRGQQKLFLCALYLAQIDLFRACTGKSSIVLIDDISSELDAANRNRLLALLTELGTQIFITTTDETLVEDTPMEKKLFHVEHGLVQARDG